MSSPLKTNTETIQNLINQINALPEAGVELPELTNEGSASDLLSGKQLINSNGSVVTGTFSIDDELATQDDLIAQLSTAVNNLPDAGSSEPTLQNKTVTPTTSKQTITADNGYDGLGTVTVNAMTTATQATPSISVNSSGLITASSTQTAGYVAAGTKSATKQLTTQAAQTITPTTTNKTIASGRYLTGTQTIKGDANLIAGNIKSGVSIFGVAGSYEGSGGSSGGSIETITVTFNSLPEPGMMIHYIDGTMSLQSASLYASSSYTIAKNTIFVVEYYVDSSFDGCPMICGIAACKAFLARRNTGGQE